MKTYQQETKSKVREQLWKQAINSLTTNRSNAVICRTSELNTTLEYSLGFLRKHQLELGWLDSAQELGESWFSFADRHTSSKSPKDLRVLFLCGPEPSNDLDVMLAHGILPQNIWAIESSKREYDAAVSELVKRHSFIRIHRGNLRGFFSRVNERFDIVYYDACGPMLMGKPNTLLPIIDLFRYERLNPLAVLITNFSEWPEKLTSEYDTLMAYYFAPRHDDFPRALWESGADPAEAQFNPHVLLTHINKNRTETYSDFTTRLITDIGRHLVPNSRIGDDPELMRRFFSEQRVRKKLSERALRLNPTHETTKEMTLSDWTKNVGDVHLAVSAYPFLSFLLRASGDSTTRNLLKPIIGYDRFSSKLMDVYTDTVLLQQVLEGHWDIASETMKEAIRLPWFDREGRQYFCDVPLPTLMVNLLIGVYARPFFLNPRLSSRIKYKAKQRTMYADCMVLDQCRYMYDWIPTEDLMSERWKDKEFQMVLRVFLDRIGWHDWGSTSHPFRGVALAGIGEATSATPYSIPTRKTVEYP